MVAHPTAFLTIFIHRIRLEDLIRILNRKALQVLRSLKTGMIHAMKLLMLAIHHKAKENQND